MAEAKLFEAALRIEPPGLCGMWPLMRRPGRSITVDFKPGTRFGVPGWPESTPSMTPRSNATGM